MFRKIASTILFLTIAVGLAFGAKTVFTDGNPSLGIKGTKVTAAFLNAVNKHFCTGLDVDGDCALAYAVATGTNDLVTTISPTTAFPAAYVDGMPLYIKTAAENIGAMTLNVNGIGQVAIKKNGTDALAAGDVAAGQIIAVSYDGTDMQLISAPRLTFVADMGAFLSSTLPSSQTWNSVAYGNGRFVAVSGTGTAAAYSIDDGTTWTASTLPSSKTWTSVVYGVGRFVAVSSPSSTAAAYSIDLGATWTASTLPSAETWTGVAYGNGRFISIAGGSSTTAMASSTNSAETWTLFGGLPSAIVSNGVAYGNGSFVIVSGTPGTASAYANTTLTLP